MNDCSFMLSFPHRMFVMIVSNGKGRMWQVAWLETKNRHTVQTQILQTPTSNGSVTRETRT